MNYKKIYKALIKKAQLRGKVNGYTEKHHIKPRALGGSDKSHNLVILTPREHFIAHLLLFKFSKGKDKHLMGYAFLLMKGVSDDHQERYFNSHLYKLIREELSKSISGKNHPMYGKKQSEEVKKTISLANKGIPKTEEHKRKISNANMNKPKTQEHRMKLSVQAKGRKLSEETKQKLSNNCSMKLSRITVLKKCISHMERCIDTAKGYYQKGNLFHAQATINGKQIKLGGFKTIKEAQEASKEKRREHLKGLKLELDYLLMKAA